MNPVLDYLLRNFFLLCISFGVVFMVLRNYRARKVDILMPILIVSVTILLGIVYTIEINAAKDPNMLFLATFCYFFGFVLRPLILFFFMAMTIKNKIALRIGMALIILNAILYSTSLFIFNPDVSHLVLWYEEGVTPEGAPILLPQRGVLYFASYVIVGIMLVYFLFMAVGSLRGPRRFDAVSSLICVAFIGFAVLIESLSFTNDLLNTTIAIACLFYIVHLYQQASMRDGLTGLFDRKTLYGDLEKLGNRVSGIIMVDMNLLKRINDTYGHQAGDRAILKIAEILKQCEEGSAMFAYRMGGDEFMILSISTKPTALEETAARIKEEIAKTEYSVSVGYANQSAEEPKSHSELMTAAERMMYADKTDFYRRSGIERRKV